MKEIVFDKIYIEGFLSIGQAEVTLSNQNFMLVQGINNEGTSTQSNGSGKSSIFEAIFWVLTGETMRGSSEVINEHIPNGCVCSLTMHDSQDTYEIKRSKKHKTFGTNCQFFVNGELVSDQIKKSESMIAQTIPSISNPEILGSIILLGQGLPFKFSSFSPIKRKELLEAIISSSEADELATALKTKSIEVTSKVSQLALNSTKIDGQIQGLLSTFEYLNREKASLKTTEELNLERERLKAKEQEILREQQENEKKSQELQVSLQELQEDKTSIERKIQQIQVSLVTAENYLSSFKSGNCPTCGRPYEVTPESDQTKQALEHKREILTNQISLYRQHLSEKTYKINDLTTQSTQQLQDKFALESLLKEIVAEMSKLDSSKQNESELTSKIQEKETEITNLKIQHQEMIKELEINQKELEYIDYMLRLTSREFKSYLVKEVIDYLSSRVAYYSTYLFDNKDVSITTSGNKILITVNDRPYENLSGGERQRTDLITQFALRDLLMVVAGFSSNLLIMDEVFDNMDSSGSQQLIKLITTELSDIDSVFIITHHEELGIPYDHRLVVEKGLNGISTVRQEE